MMKVTLNWFDICAIIAYFILVIGFGIWSSFKNRGSIGGYFLAGRSMNFLPIAASLYSSNIGSMHFIGFAGSGAADGISIAGFEIYGPMVYILLGWVFLPVYIRAGVFTMPGYIKKRFGGERISVYLALLSLLLYIFTKLSADLYAGALFIKLSLNLDLYVSIGVLLFLSALFTIGGGLSTVMWTDFIQTIVMFCGALYLMITSFAKVGGLSGMKHSYSYAVANTVLHSNSTCGLPSKRYFDMIKPFDSDFPWSGLLIGQLIAGTWYVSNDQVIVQRALAAKSLTHAKAGCLGCGYLKLLSLFLMVMPGMVSRILFPDEVACADPEACKAICGNEGGCTNVAYAYLVINLLPTGARGIMLAVMMAALMSSITSIFNSTSTIFTFDIWKKVRRNAPDWELMIVGRICVLFLVAISIIWVPILNASQGSQLFDYIQSVTNFLAPPVCSVFVCAVFFKRINEQGAFWGLIAGLITGMTRFIWQHMYDESVCAKGINSKTPAIISKVHYLHFGIILFIISMTVSWAVSLLTEPIPEEHLRRLTFFTKNEPREPVPIPEPDDACFGLIHPKKPKSKYQNENRIINGKDEDLVEEIIVRTELSVYKRIAYWFCGIESAVDTKGKFKTTMEETPKVDISIEEEPLWANINNANMVFQLCLSGFMWVFFNKYN